MACVHRCYDETFREPPLDFLSLFRVVPAAGKRPDFDSEVFVLRNIEHVPFNEVATRLGRSPGAARVLWTRAMQRLSQLLEEK